MKYIVLFRGINVGGKRVKMAHLKEIFESMGFNNVKTFLQSGNVLFEYDSINTAKMASEIVKELNKIFGFPIDIIIRNENELEDIINSNPFIRENNIEIDKLHVTFLQDASDKKTVLGINKEDNERFDIIGKEIFLYLPNGYARTKLTNNMFEKKLKTIATTRNWKTTNKLLDLSKSG